MAKLDFPDASYSPWVAPNNVIYTYIGTSPNGYWEANTANASTNLTSVFVERAGSIMTGALKLDNAGSVSLPDISFDGDVNTGLYSPGADSLAITTAGTQRVTVNSSGKVGIGTSSPAEKLDVNGAIVSTNTNNTSANAGASRAIIDYSGNGARIGHFKGSTSSGNGSLGLWVDSSEKLRINSSGNVGIGVSSFGAKLEVKGAVASYSGTTPKSYLYTTNGGIKVIGAESALDLVSTDSGTHASSILLRGQDKGFALVNNKDNDRLDLKSFTASADGFSVHGNAGVGTSAHVNIAAITKAGNVGIGITSLTDRFEIQDTTQETTQLTVRSRANTGIASIGIVGAPNGGGSRALYLKYLHATDKFSLETTTGNGICLFKNSGGEHLNIDSSGKVGIGTTSPSSYYANHLVVSGSAEGGITIDGPTTGQSYLAFADGTSGNERYRGYIAYDHATDSLKLASGAGEHMRIDSSGRLLVGHTATVDTSTFNSNLQLMGTDSHGSSATLGRFSADAGAPSINLSKSRNGTKGSHTIVNNNDSCGNIFWWASDGSDYEQVAQIGAEIDGTPGTNDTPGRLVFSTTADGASTSTERMRIDSSGTATFGVFPQSTSISGNSLIKFNAASTANIICRKTDSFYNTNHAFEVQNNTGAVTASITGTGAATFAADASINGITVGRGGSNVNGNIAIGLLALDANTSGSSNTGVGAQALDANTTGSQNSAFGTGSLQQSTTGSYNTAIGRSALFSNITGSENVATGYQALSNNTTGNNNTATGFKALLSNTTGADNTATGKGSLHFNTTGNNNIANGFFALFANTTGSSNTACGRSALYTNTTGNNNTATGRDALVLNTTGSSNTATGYDCLRSNTTGSSNTATGYDCLRSNTTASDNTANGVQSLRSNTTGTRNVSSGYQALYSNTTGNYNVANGSQALYTNTTGSNNVAVGKAALYQNTTAVNNTAIGDAALYANTTASNNTAFGTNCLHNNSTGGNNVSVGSAAMFYNTTGANNVATGYQALLSNTTGYQNIAIGFQALFSNTTAFNNTATGHQALYANTTGNNNVAIGYNVLVANTTGNKNTANGYQAMVANTTGYSNVANGYRALFSNTTGIENSAYGTDALSYNTTGSNNVSLGYYTLINCTTGSGNIGIGHVNSGGAQAATFNVTTENNRLVLGHTSITNAYVQVAWTVTSDERDKMNFAPVPYGLDFVNQLKPTAYQFKVGRDTETPNGDVRYGFKAQDILALEGDNPVIIDTEDADHLKYKGEHLVPVLVNAVQELTAMVKELQNEVAALKSAQNLIIS